MNIIKLTELFPYIIVGGITTLIDWMIFATTTTYFHFPYQLSLISAYLIAGTVHYTANKWITFKCHSKQMGAQVSLFIMVNTASLGCSLGILTLLVNVVSLNSIRARMLTTILMLLPNYLLHKHITFSKKIFIQPEG